MNKQKFSEIWETINHTSICIIEISELEEGKKQAEKILEEIMLKTTNLLKTQATHSR